MNSLLKIKNKKFLVYGLGKTGLSVVKFFKQNKIKDFRVWDDKFLIKYNKKTNIKKKLNRWIEQSDNIIISPGINYLSALAGPFLKKYFHKIITDLDLFYKIYPKITTIMVTGTNGKSTTCKIIYDLIKNSRKYNSYLLGNIGRPVLDIKPKKNCICIIEASSFQLFYSKNLNPDHALLINLSRDHIDWHKNESNYQKSKFRIFLNQNRGDFAYLENKLLIKEFIKQKYKSKLIHVKQNDLKKLKNKILIEYFKNEANYQNLRFAFKISKRLKISDTNFLKTINNFKPLKHRGEIFMKKKGFLFVNDSKATSFDSARNSLSNFKNIYWILGGTPKSGEKINLDKYRDSIKKIYLIGKNIKFYKKKIKRISKFQVSKTISNAILDISRDIKKEKKKLIRTILLCPAGSSYDQFNNFENRGNFFKNKIKSYVKKKYF